MAHIGFNKLKSKLAGESGVTDPAGLAATIGRKKFGKAGMEKKAAAGKKKSQKDKLLARGPIMV
jgi:hypothetical protein